jgi:hypothetical protein
VSRGAGSGVQRGPSSPVYQCPGNGRRAKDAYGVARDRFATLDPTTAPQDPASIEVDGPE